MSANEYINTLFQYISDLFKRPPYNECKNGVFPEEFMKTVSNIFKRLFRVYAHVYHHHLNVSLGLCFHCSPLLKRVQKPILIRLLSTLCCLRGSIS